MPPRGVKGSKAKRQYEHIKKSAEKSGKGSRAKEIAARTVNKARRKAGETKSAPRRAAAGKTSRKKTSTRTARGKTASRSRSTTGRAKSSTSRAKSSRAKKR
ncbi:hypothetical protein [Stigmatella aurantiaca]|uniref:Plasmid stabilization protein n=1 Tax=Stigmatella aurantiaca (strain DW4/3-1) TaxID=378806 RepID=Q08T65_STIAD|nr:hypothetical protein [Stigmatella aurantiaca]EAU63662.1 conserved hypothetical protein [Stigmatella aurantiaca DW4/3-1]